ncbi:LpqB family beta-propeller domain-containing protein [Nocardioides campestrisoli]|uniref:LpqB family beta-propeller domain-containing protein n=1 Tax=Nocardioides campestrisoli TaxID=2736757 RepID=UPI0015E742C5|nr:LpqB family beta-propeller domain-containing protein [Nocardioides campestrisoli]
MTPRWRAVAATAAALLLAGCVQMPTAGPILEVEDTQSGNTSGGTFIDPAPPEPGASAREVVSGFLEAMKAAPIKTTVAAQYLSSEAQVRWKPEGGTITYSDLDPVRGDRVLTVPMVDAEVYDSRGAWSRSLRAGDAELSFPMTLEGAEWRIAEAPDALVVPESWFEDRFSRAALYFLDPTGRILVPEPVFVPEGDQFATSLVRGLLAGPPRHLGTVVRSTVPAGLSLALSVPIDDDGLAEVSLQGPPGVSAEDLVSDEMIAQVAWTLRQDPRITAVRLTLNGRAVPLPGHGQELSPAAGARLDPVGSGSVRDLFALRDGLLVRGDLEEFDETSGPLGSQQLGVRTAAVNLTATQAAAVTTDGTSLLVAPVEDEEGVATELFAGGTDLLPPVWDFTDRLWWVDRTAGGAVVWTSTNERARQVRVPGLTGRNVTSFLVSRDGSRLAAVVREPGGDRVVTGRIQRDERGRVLGATRVRPLDLELEPGRRINDMGWRSPSSLTLLSDITGDLSQVRTVAVEGAPADLDTGATSRIRGGAGTLVSSPARNESVYVVQADGVADLVDPAREIPPLDEGITWLGFVG